MNTGRNNKRVTSALGLAAAAVAAPALLFLGAGTAHAGGVTITGWETWPGTIVAHLKDQSGTPSWCTYSSDWYVAPAVFVDANMSAAVVMTPSTPEFRMWSVNVSCTNGSTYHGSKYY